ncbi:uncharacterized protein LOC115626579 [Scaptodrosophila lebanonensis]|uniref:Uncharacterized protein LOC115626579 n=1 Tax=Drosophila lebanonensis TaxID=7225 RepID=A0A6J2TQN5_DROLE|nr:uncharacterized protein LOC115626579 [Scaptodrosophila lebanonensis]
MLLLKLLLLLIGVCTAKGLDADEDEQPFHNYHVFANSHQNRGFARILTTIEKMSSIWFTTRVYINNRRLVDYFQTNLSEPLEPLLWYRSKNLTETLLFFGITSVKKLPYTQCYYHVSNAYFFNDGFRNVSSRITLEGNSKRFFIVHTSMYVTTREKSSKLCTPFFTFPRCFNISQPLVYDTATVLVLRAEFERHCPLDKYTTYTWTLHDSTEDVLLDFLGGTLVPEIKIGKYKLNIHQQSKYTRCVLLRLNVRIIGRSMPLVARCYLALAAQRLIASIRGGAFRHVFLGKTIKVSGLPSRDLSLSPFANQHLIYNWSCECHHRQIIRTCKEDMGTNMTFKIPAYSQPHGQDCYVSLMVQSTFDPVRAGVAKQIIKFTRSRRTVHVNILCETNCAGNKYSADQIVHLKAKCVRCHGMKVFNWTWRFEEEIIAENTNRLIYEIPYTVNRQVNIRVDIQAKKWDSDDGKWLYYHGRTWVILERNQGPIDSICQIEPQSGTALETTFDFKCQAGQTRFRPMQYCISVRGLLIEDCKKDENFKMRLPATKNLNVKACDPYNVCQNVKVDVNVEPFPYESSESSFDSAIKLIRRWLEYADWQRAFLIIYQLVREFDTKERLLQITDAMSVYLPQAAFQVAHVARIAREITVTVAPFNDMEAMLVARLLGIVAHALELIIANNELDSLMEEYYNVMVDDLLDIVDYFYHEWEFIPDAQCHAEAQSCLNIDIYGNRHEQMHLLHPHHLEIVNNWMHAHWKLSSCAFLLGMGTAQRLKPGEGFVVMQRNTFTMQMEAFDIEEKTSLHLTSKNLMHEVLLSEEFINDVRERLNTTEILISMRSANQSQFWWYPEQESQTQVLVVNIYSSRKIWERTWKLNVPIRFISKFRIDEQNTENTTDSNFTRKARQAGFDEPEPVAENVVNDNVHNSEEIRMYHADVLGHAILGITFTHVDIDYQVLLRSTYVPKLEDMDQKDATCLISSSKNTSSVLLFRNLCNESRRVYIYLRAANRKEPWDEYQTGGATFTFSTEIRFCRLWAFTRPEPDWQNTACIPEMNKSVTDGIQCECDYVSAFDADASPIIVTTMKPKCHLEQPKVERNYQMIGFYIFITAVAILYLYINMQSAMEHDKRLYVEQRRTGKPCRRGDIIVKFTFGGRYNAGTSANLIFSFISARGTFDFVVYQNPLIHHFDRNTTITFRLQRELVQLPARLALGHDNTGIYPHYYCRNVVVHDMLTGHTQNFRFMCWLRGTPTDNNYMRARLLIRDKQTPKDAFSWKLRFAMSMENYMGNWYLFQPIIGPWRYGIGQRSLTRWERSCIFICKMFITLSVVVIYFGKSVSIDCDPNRKKYNDVDMVIGLCFVCFFISSAVQVVLELLLRFITYSD